MAQTKHGFWWISTFLERKQKKNQIWMILDFAGGALKRAPHSVKRAGGLCPGTYIVAA